MYITSYCHIDKSQSKINTKFKIDLLDKNICQTLDNNYDTIVCFRFNLFLKSNETLNIFFNILHSSHIDKFSIGFINNKMFDSKLQIVNSEIKYYYKQLTNEKIFNTCKIFINDLTNENQLIEYIIDYDYLIEFFKVNGFECKFTTNENFYTFCTFEKSNYFGLNLKIQKSTIIPYKKIHNIPFEQILSFYKINNNNDIVDLINCFGYSIHSNKNMELIPSEFCKIQNIPFNGEITNEKCLFFHTVIQQNEDEIQEELLYIVLYDNQILTNQFIIYKILYKTDIDKMKNEISLLRKNNEKIKLSLINSYLNTLQLQLSIFTTKQKIDLLNQIIFEKK